MVAIYFYNDYTRGIQNKYKKEEISDATLSDWK